VRSDITPIAAARRSQCRNEFAAATPAGANTSGPRSYRGCISSTSRVRARSRGPHCDVRFDRHQETQGTGRCHLAAGPVNTTADSEDCDPDLRLPQRRRSRSKRSSSVICSVSLLSTPRSAVGTSVLCFWVYRHGRRGDPGPTFKGSSCDVASHRLDVLPARSPQPTHLVLSPSTSQAARRGVDRMAESLTCTPTRHTLRTWLSRRILGLRCVSPPTKAR
jgi:hypothetical protein